MGVKTELGEPDPARPNEGRLHFQVEWYALVINLSCEIFNDPHSSALASPEFERRGGEELGSYLAQLMSRAYQHDGCVDLTSLCVSTGQRCWILYIDGLVCNLITVFLYTV